MADNWSNAAMLRLVDKDFSVIRSQQLPNKLTIAGAGDYDKVWIRDNVYVALAFVEAGNISEAATIYAELFKIIQRYEATLDLSTYPTQDSELVLPRFTTNGDPVPDHWSNKQHDAIGALLFGTGQLYDINAAYVTDVMRRLCQKLVTYLERCHYWDDTDNGMWEESPPVQHASSLAACIRGIEMVGGFCAYDTKGHEQAKANLAALLPHESTDHPVDMALLSLIWPYGYKLETIVSDIETYLLKDNGVIRYIGDMYESAGSSEPEWVLGVPWLGIAHYELGHVTQAQSYLQRTEALYTPQGLPESYVAHNESCIHTPLAWSHAMAIVLRTKLQQR